MKVGQAHTHLKALNLDSDSQPGKESQLATKLDVMDSPHSYRDQPRKPRGARKHEVQAPKRRGGLQDMLLAQAHAGKHDSAEIYRPMFGPTVEADNQAAGGWLRAADFDADTLSKMSSVDFNNVDFSRPEQPDDLSDGSDTALDAHASDKSAYPLHAGSINGADDEDAYDFEYVPHVTLGASLRLSSRGAARLARMSDEELAKTDVTDYFEAPSRRRSIDAPATSAANS